jgi:TolB-like protein/lipoprotein NlpI
MLTREGNVKITDFGVAKLRGAADLTKAGSTIGTLAYMAPEQLRGEDVDQRSDLFSLGVVLYEMATLHLPFRGEHEAALMYSIANEEPTPVSSLRPDFPAALEHVIAKCLNKDRTLRYQSADEIGADLRACQHQSTGTGKAMVVKERSRLPWIAGAIAVLAAIGLYLFMPASHPARANSKTIAVLPFRNLTEQKEEEYFSDGITDDILTQLSKIADLKVISRTSMMQYKGTKKSLKEIGSELNAGVILEGSVRRSENQIRIVAQLIDANNDEHLWADTYDREYTHVFAIQSEIAQKIAASLQANLSAAEKERLAHPATANVDAYNAYLKGSYFVDRRSKEDYERAIGSFEQALTIDPNYARAWVGLARVHSSQADRGYVPVDEGYAKARMEAGKALELDPILAEAHAIMGWVRMSYDWDWNGADAAYKQALELDPGNPDVVGGSATLATTLGRFDEAMRLFRRAIELDPIRVRTHFNLGVAAYRAGRWEEAETAYRTVLELNPQFPSAHNYLGQVYLSQSKPKEALAEMHKEPEPFRHLYGLALAYCATGMQKEADAALAEVIDKNQDDAAFQIAEIYAYRRETDKAFKWLERAYKQRDGGLAEMKGDPLLRSIEGDSRYAEFMKKMKLPL